MVIAVFGESCVGKSTIAAGIAILAATAYARSRRTARRADIAPFATTSAGRG